MPKRINKTVDRYESSEVQGDDSWVDIRTPTFDDLQAVLNGADPDAVTTQIEMSKKLVDRLVVDWNWVDDDGNDLPKPSAKTIKDLPLPETMFLIKCVQVEDIEKEKK